MFLYINCFRLKSDYLFHKIEYKINMSKRNSNWKKNQKSESRNKSNYLKKEIITELKLAKSPRLIN